MRKTIFVSLIVLVFGCFVYAQSKSDGAAGTWSGTWTGGSTGKFEMTIKKEAGGKLSASLTATPDQGDGYTVNFKFVEPNGNKLTMKFDDPSGEVEGTLQAVVEGSSIKGDYSIRAKANGEEVDKGTFTASRK
ncbi:MAG: hypothetical protein ACRD9Y_22075 [Blastocatellia bacterium]